MITEIDTSASSQDTILYDDLATELDRASLAAHLGRKILHASHDRNFAFAQRKTKDDRWIPQMYTVGGKGLGKCEYVRLTNKQYAAVLVLDIDTPGDKGGHPFCLDNQLTEKLHILITHRIGPAWLGINPSSGKCQAIWLIDPVYADKGGDSPQMRLLRATAEELGEFLGHDEHFSHGFSRNPFYTGASPTAYKWYRQHTRVMRVGDLIKEVRKINPVKHTPTQQFTSGRELINAVKARREQAQLFKTLALDVASEVGNDLDKLDPNLVDGVRIVWSVENQRAARDTTGFRHALKIAHRLHHAHQRMKDEAIIDAYEHGYNTAHQVGGDGRKIELPPMRDRLTMARRVRGYVTHSKTTGIQGDPVAGVASPSQRKALATMGRRGGKKAAQRWKTDTEGEYTEKALKPLQEANKKREVKAQTGTFTIAGWFSKGLLETGQYPTLREAVEELKVSEKTVRRALKRANISLPLGRRKSTN